MPRLIDEQNPDDWDGQDWAEKLDDSKAVFGREMSSQQLPANIQDLNRRINGEPESYDGSISTDSGYSVDWPNVGARMRRLAGFRCRICQISLGERKYLLQIHHNDRDKNNNDDTNLQALCALCHASLDGHTHLLLKIVPDDLAFIKRLQEKLGTASPAIGTI